MKGLGLIIVAPIGHRVNNEFRDGMMVVDGGSGKDVNYNPTSRDSSAPSTFAPARQHAFAVTGVVARYPQPVTDEDFVQPRECCLPSSFTHSLTHSLTIHSFIYSLFLHRCILEQGP
jgi:catalase